jgi:hypothetical protein
MSAIDHKAKAEKYLDDAQGFFWEDDPTQVTLRLVAAQVHATLALVEQTAALVEEQRTANLIANSSFERGAGYGIPKERLLEIQGRLA